MAGLFNAKNSYLRDECFSKLGVSVTSAEEFTKRENIESLLQIALLASDESIHHTLNSLIWLKEIEIPNGELRRSKLAKFRTGSFGVRMEASELGVRHLPDSDLMFVRLRAILNKAFPRDDTSAQEQLKWLLRAYEGDTPEARLQEAINSMSPAALVERLLVSNKSACETAFSELGLPLVYTKYSSDEDVTRLLTWHLGFNAASSQVSVSDIQDGVDGFRRIVQGLSSTELGKDDVKRIRSEAGKFFPELEGFLKAVLRFTAWALLNDHYGKSYEMRYMPSVAKEFFDNWIARFIPGQDNSDRLTLVEIADRFGILVRELKGLIGKEAELARSEDDYPRVVREAPIYFNFSFAHTVPFVDLDATSQERIINTLSRICSKLNLQLREQEIFIFTIINRHPQ